MADVRPIPSRLQLMRGNPGKRRIRPDLEPTPVPEPPEPPAFLTDFAKEEWRRVAAELCERGVLSVLDLGMLGVYCQSYGRWRELDAAVQGRRAGRRYQPPAPRGAQ